MLATVSTCPWTKCPPIRVLALTALSKLTLDPCFKAPRLVRRRVSGATPTLNEDLSNSVTVKHVPLTEIESPNAASPKISAQSDMVKEVPFPPDVEGSSCCRLVTAKKGCQNGV